MRTREEIENEMIVYAPSATGKRKEHMTLEMELLLDIRDLLKSQLIKII